MPTSTPIQIGLRNSSLLCWSRRAGPPALWWTITITRRPERSWISAGATDDPGQILLANPQLHRVLFDRITQGLDLYFDVAGLGDRTEVITGDFFQGVPTGGDIYLLSAILHNWNDTEAIHVARSARPWPPAASC